jgi:hypothetical protein
LSSITIGFKFGCLGFDLTQLGAYFYRHSGQARQRARAGTQALQNLDSRLRRNDNGRAHLLNHSDVRAPKRVEFAAKEFKKQAI